MKRITILLVLLCATLAQAAPTTKTVCASGCDYTTLAAATAAAQAGWTINLTDATYTESASCTGTAIGVIINGLGVPDGKGGGTKVTLNAAGGVGMQITGYDWSFNDLELELGPATVNTYIRLYGDGDFTFTDAKISVASDAAVSYCLRADGDGIYTFNNVDFENNSVTGEQLVMNSADGACTLIMTDCALSNIAINSDKASAITLTDCTVDFDIVPTGTYVISSPQPGGDVTLLRTDITITTASTVYPLYNIDVGVSYDIRYCDFTGAGVNNKFYFPSECDLEFVGCNFTEQAFRGWEASVIEMTDCNWYSTAGSEMTSFIDLNAVDPLDDLIVVGGSFNIHDDHDPIDEVPDPDVPRNVMMINRAADCSVDISGVAFNGSDAFLTATGRGHAFYCNNDDLTGGVSITDCTGEYLTNGILITDSDADDSDAGAVLLEGNTFSFIRSYGYYLSTNDAVIRNCVLENRGYAAGSTSHNYIIGNDSQDNVPEFDKGLDCTIENCSSFGGGYLYISKGVATRFISNYGDGNFVAQGIAIRGGLRPYAFNNKIVNATAGFRLTVQSPGVLDNPCVDGTVIWNEFLNCKDHVVRLSEATALDGDWTIDHNTYSLALPTTDYYDEWGSDKTLAEWQAEGHDLLARLSGWGNRPGWNGGMK